VKLNNLSNRSERRNLLFHSIQRMIYGRNQKAVRRNNLFLSSFLFLVVSTIDVQQERKTVLGEKEEILSNDIVDLLHVCSPSLGTTLEYDSDSQNYRFLVFDICLGLF